MKVLENITHYQCDFCKKKMVRKHAMINHEPRCRSNPDNIRACFGCKFCEKRDSSIFYDGIYGEMEVVSHKLHCTKLSKDMLTLRAELNGYCDKYDVFDNQEPMPKNCEHRNDVYDNIEEW